MEVPSEKETICKVPQHSKHRPKDVLDLIGEWRFTQKLVYLFLQYALMLQSWHILAITFLAPSSQDFWCINPTPSVSSAGDQRCLVTLQDNQTVQPCTQWNFSHTEFRATLTEELEMVCERSWLVSFCKSLIMASSTIMNLAIGSIADKMGRRPSVILAIFPGVVGSFLILSTNHVTTFGLGQALLGSSSGILNSPLLILLTEISGPDYRSLLGVSSVVGYTLGAMLLGVVSWLSRDWYKVQLVSTVLTTLPVLFVWFLPESPSWLLVNNRVDEAVVAIGVIAKRNGMLIDHISDKVKTLAERTQVLTKGSRLNLTRPSAFDLVKHPVFMKRTAMTLFSRFVVGLVYYGVTMNVEFFGENLFQDFFFSAFLALPSTLLALFALRFFTIKNVLTACVIGQAVVCLLHALGQGLSSLSSRGLQTILVVMGWSFSSPASFLINQFTTELFPTVVRGKAAGFGSLMSRTGGFLASYCREMDDLVGRYVAMSLFAFLCTLTVVCLFFLPETSNQKLPDTIQEMEDEQPL